MERNSSSGRMERNSSSGRMERNSSSGRMERNSSSGRMERNSSSEFTVSSSLSCDSSVEEEKEKRKRKNFFSEVTPGSLEVWVDLPDEIKFDPALAPFRHQYEHHHGKLEAQSPPNHEGDKSIFQRRISELIPIGESTEPCESPNKESAGRLMHQLNNEEKVKIRSTRRKQLSQVLRVVKLSALVASWVLLTAALLLNREKRDVILHTAVKAGVLKEYQLLPSDGRVSLLVKLTGPFADSSINASVDDDSLHLWLHRRSYGNDSRTIEQNSTSWLISLQPAAAIDFSQSVTEEKILILEEWKSGAAEQQAFKKIDGEEDWHEKERDDGGRNDTTVTLRMHTTSDTVPLTITYQVSPLEEKDGIIYAALLLCVLYALIIFEIVNRTIAALLSSSLAVAVLATAGARPTLPELVSWLDVETLLLLLSMMLLVAILADTGLFDYLAVVAAELTGGRTWPLINCLCFFTAFFSTFLDNVTTVLLMTPVTIRLCEVMQLNPVPVLMSMVIFSNVGGAATPVGDPPNVIIASHPAVLDQNINFTQFTLHMGMGILLVAVQTYLQLRFIYRDMNKLRHSVPTDIQELRQEIGVWRRAAASLSSYSRDEDIVRKALEKKVLRLCAALSRREGGEGGGGSKADLKFTATLVHLKQKYRVRDKPLLIKSAVCVSFVVVVFFLHAFPELQRLSLGWTALLGALLLLLLSEREDLEPVLARVEWSTLLFFAALFVLMEALSKLGLISWIGRLTESVILQVGEESRLAVALMLVLWVSGIASAFVDNIPLTTMMVRVVAALADERGLALPLAPLAWALSFGACLGGNGTLIGASANVVCAGVAEQHGYRFTFLQFARVGFPVMLGNLLVASLYLLLCHCVFTWH